MLYKQFVAEVQPEYPTPLEQDADDLILAIARSLREDPTFYCAVALDEDRVCGFFLSSITIRLLGSPKQMITAHMVYLNPDDRGKGGSRGLLGAAWNWYREHYPQITHVECMVRPNVSTPWVKYGLQPYATLYQGSLKLGPAYLTGRQDNG